MPRSTSQHKADSIGFLLWFCFAIIFASMIFFLRLFVSFKQTVLGFVVYLLLMREEHMRMGEHSVGWEESWHLSVILSITQAEV